MLRLFTSNPALALASAAALSLTATPALARHYRHNDRIDGGDVLAGVLILGGIAAVASAASKSNRDRSNSDDRYRQTRYPDRGYPTEPDYRDSRDYRGDDSRYGSSRSSESSNRSDWRGAGNIDGAVNACVSELERGNQRVGSVEGVNREADAWRVDGRLEDGRSFSCTAGSDGRIQRATVDGRALT